MSETNKQKVFDFISNEKYCVLSTVNTKGKPEAATMSFVVTNNLEVMFSTSKLYRKYGNIQNNNNVAIVFGVNGDDFVTVQYEGEISELTENVDYFIQKKIEKYPETAKYANDPDNVYLIVKPKWIKYSDLKQKEIFEASL